MSIFDPRTWFTKSVSASSVQGWQNYGGYADLQPPIDHIAYRRNLTPQERINLFRDTVYYCAGLNARGIARSPLYLYRKKGTGERAIKGAKQVSRLAQMRLKSMGYSDSDDVDEIEDHPFLDLMRKPFVDQGIAVMGQFTFLEVTQLYLEIVGRSYWLMDATENGPPSQLFPLMAHYVEPWRNTQSDRFVDEYRYYVGQMQKFQPNQIVPFNMASLEDPYTGGLSPLQAAADRFGVSISYLSQTQAWLNNRARPDVIISAKGQGDVLSQPTAKRISKWWSQQFGKKNLAKPLIATDPIEVTPLQFSLKDLGELRDEEEARKQIGRCFDIPQSMLDKDATNASAIEGRKQHASDALLPRQRRIEHAINSMILPRYDPSGRLFVCFDEPYREPLSPTATEAVALVNAHVLMPDEVRELMGYGPMPEEYKAELEQRRQEEMQARQQSAQQQKPTDRMTPKEFSAYYNARVAIRNGKAVHNGCRH